LRYQNLFRVKHFFRVRQVPKLLYQKEKGKMPLLDASNSVLSPVRSAIFDTTEMSLSIIDSSGDNMKIDVLRMLKESVEALDLGPSLIDTLPKTKCTPCTKRRHDSGFFSDTQRTLKKWRPTPVETGPSHFVIAQDDPDAAVRV